MYGPYTVKKYDLGGSRDLGVSQSDLSASHAYDDSHPSQVLLQCRDFIFKQHF